VFRLREHVRRLENSAKVYRMPIAFTGEELIDACCETIRANDLAACYIRPIVFRGFGHTIGVNPLHNPVDVFIACWSWGKYLGEEAESGVDVCVSSWRRIAADSMPAVSKATGNYLNGQLIKIEAVTNGYAEGLALDARGFVSEGSGENVFMVQDGVLLTPPLAASVLQLYTCDELFMTGTAAEITPIRSVDRNPVGHGCPGEVTQRIMAEFRGIVSGEIADRYGWLHPVGAAVRQAAAAVPER